MVPAPDPDVAAVADQAAVRQQLWHDFCELEERLLAMVDVYEESPSSIDNSVLDGTDPAVDVTATIAEVYRAMKTKVYGKDSPLRADNVVWQAFEDQKEEFIGFYRAALKAVEVYREVLATYNQLRSDAGPRPERGDLERIRMDKHAHVDEREACIEAVSNFQGKFSAMLTILQDPDHL